MLPRQKEFGDNFEFSEEIFVSDHTIVYRGRQVNTLKNVIIKTINAEYPSNRQLANIRHEYEILKKLKNECSIEVLELIDFDNKIALIIDDIKATSFRTLIDNKMELDVTTFLEISLKIIDFLGTIHNHNIIHKDINPNNIIFNSETNSLKIIDFGISTELSRERQDINVANKLEGSLPYISPEQTGRMNCDLDYRSDYYSLGITLFEIITGQLPFASSDTIGWIHAHIAKTPPLAHNHNQNIPEIVSQILFKLMSKNTEDRYQSSNGIRKDFEKCLREYRASGKIESFNLGKDDVSKKFKIRQKIYGRKNELELLKNIFETVAAGNVEILLVSGHSGIGKSVLIRSAHQDIVREKGYFIEGKCEQFQKNIPYSTFIQCFQNLVAQILTESLEQLELWNKKIQKAIHPNGKIITNLVPSIEKIIGSQENLNNDLGPKEAQNRFFYTVKNFIGVFAQPEHPLLVFLDDLQWSDVPTLKLIEYLMSTTDLKSFFLIGSYRNNEVKSGHPLKISLNEIEKDKVIHSIYLKPLNEQDVNQIVAETVHSDLETAAPLARSIYEKTRGNPFFVETILKNLYQENYLVFDNQKGRWKWDIDKISAISVTDNVVDLIIHNLQKIERSTNRLLQLASCIGKIFDLKTLSLICGDSIADTSKSLFPAIATEIIVPLSDKFKLVELQREEDQSDFGVSYQFQHDRVQQAANSMLDSKERQILHLKIARLFKKTFSKVEFEEKLIDIVHHFNEGIDLIDDKKERGYLCRLNLEVGKKARFSNAYEPGFTYLSKSKDLLESDSWDNEYDLSFEVFKEYTLLAYLSGNTKESNESRKVILKNAKTTVEKLKLYHIELAQYASIGRLEEAIDTGIKAFALSGIKLKLKTSKFAVIKEIIEARWNLRNKKIETLIDGPELKDEEKIILMEICSDLSLPLYYMGHENLYAVVVLKAANIALKHGICAVSGLSFLGYSIILNGVLGHFTASNEFGKLGVKINERYNDLENRCQVLFLYALFVHCWNNPPKLGVPIYEEAREVGLQTGDLIQVGIIGYLLPIWQTDYTLPEAVAAAKENMEFAISYKLYDAVDAGRIFQQFRYNLMGKTKGKLTLDDSIFNTTKLLNSMRERNFTIGVFLYYAMMVKIRYTYEAYESSINEIPRADELSHTTIGALASVEYAFGIFITYSQSYIAANSSVKRKAMKRMKAEYKKMKKWHNHCTSNSSHFFHIMNAEFFRIKGEVKKAVQSYKKAMKESVINGFSEYKTLSTELIARYYIDLNEDKIATLYMTEAYFDYQLLGASGKQNHMIEKYGPFINLNRQHQGGTSSITITNNVTRTTTAEFLDIETVAKAAQNLSSEVLIEKLLRKLMYIVQENAGAEKSVLLLVEKLSGGLTVQAKSVGNNEIEIMSNEKFDETNIISNGIVNYVSRTHENVVLGDASIEGEFQNDLYILRNTPKSILCVPILNQGNLIGILYLENNMTSNSFTEDRLLVLNILCSQAAISIENAQLYQNLEYKVRERTEELSQKNRDIQSMLQNMNQGIFTIVDHNTIHPKYSSWLENIFNTKDIAGTKVVDLIFKHSSIDKDKVSQIENALSISIGEAEFKFSLNRHVLVNEMTVNIDDNEKILELEWNPIVDEFGIMEKVLVIVKDVTEIRVLQLKAKEQQTELEKIGQILQLSIANFTKFVEEAKILLDKNESQIQQNSVKNQKTIEELFRNMHTLKGISRLHNLTFITEVVHIGEESYSFLKTNDEYPWNQKDLLLDIQKIRNALAEYEDILNTKLTFYKTAKENQKIRLLDSLNEQSRNIDPADSSSVATFLNTIQDQYSVLNFQKLSAILELNISRLPRMAELMNKLAPDVEIHDPDQILFGEGASKLLSDVFTHCFSNIIDHGIETPEIRASKGKSEQGNIHIELYKEDQVVIIFKDDGAGLNLDALRKSGLAHDILSSNEDISDQQIADTIFYSGVSTSENITANSGRGVGMDAVRKFLREHNGNIEILLDGERYEHSFRMFHFKIKLSNVTK
ncbi:AAA family ATPase [Bacteriovoracaceae bacterium]|nr:AAA family ATPase [Bacteriovoracaceae bacterium]